MTQPSYNQDNYRFFSDDANEASSTALGTGNNQALDMDVGTSGRVQVRVECHNTNAKAGVLPFSFEFNIDSGGWTTLDGTTDVRIYESTYNTHDEDTSQRLSSSTPYDTTNAACINSATDPVTNSNVDASVYIEVVATIYLVDGQFTGGESIQLRVVDGQTFTYTNYPTINVNNPPVVVTPSPVTTIAGRVNPTVLQSSTTATPTPASAICNKVDPTVIDSVVGLNCTNWRFRDDSTALNTDGGWLAALNVAPTTIDMGVPFRLRLEIEENNGVAETHSYKLQFRINGGTWYDCGIHLNDNHTAVIADFSAQFLDNDATTNLLSGSSETFTAGHAIENDNLTTSDTLQNEHTEFEWALMLMRRYDTPSTYGELDDGDTVEIRVVESDGTLLDNYRAISFEANYPYGLVGGCFIESPQSCGPFQDDNGNLYFPMEHTSKASGAGNTPIMVKSTDDGATWFEIDGTNRPSSTYSDFESGQVQQIGDTLHIFQHKGASVYYHTFNMSSASSNPDTWQTVGQAIVTGITCTDQAVAGVVLSDGDAWCFYRETVGGYERISYKRRTSGSWGSANNLDAEATTNWTWVTATVGASNLTHIGYQEITNGSGNMWYRNLSSGGTLSGRSALSAVSGTNNNNSKGIAQPVYWDDSGDEKVMFVFRNSANTMWYRIATNGSLGTASQIGSITVNRAEGGSNMLSAQATGDGQGNVYLIYSDITNEDLFLATYNGSWTTDITLDTGTDVTIDFQQLRYYTNSSGEIVIGYIVENDPAEGRDTGPMWFNEYVLGLLLSPSPASAVTGKVDPTVDISGGDETVTPAAVTGVASSVNPTVYAPFTYTPTAVSAIASSIKPGVWPISDDFEDYNTGALAGQGYWVQGQGTFNIVDNSGDNVADPNTDNEICVYNTITPPSSDYAAQAVIDADVNAAWVGVAVRANSDPDYYAAYTDDNQMYVGRVINGTWNLLDSGSLTVNTGDIIYLQVSGTGATVTLRVLLNGSPITGIGDTSGYIYDTHADRITTTGYAGLSGYGLPNSYIDNFQAFEFVEDLVVEPAAVTGVASSVNPTVVKGSITVSPTAVNAIANKADPTVVLGNTTVTPTTASAIGSTVDPTVVHGSVTIDITVTEDFTGAEGAMPPPWYNITDRPDLRRTGSGEFYNSTGAIAGASFYRGKHFAGNQYSQFLIKDTSVNNIGVIIRATSDGDESYWITWKPSDNTIYLYRFLAPSTWNVPDTFVYTEGFTTNDIFRVEVVGYDFHVYKNGTRVTTLTDSSQYIPSGYPGVFAYNTVVRGDDWEAGNTKPWSGTDVAGPTVILGDITVTTTPVSSITNKVDPTVILGSLTVTPSPASGVSSSVNPTTVLGSTTATPTPASAIGNKADPDVVLGSITLSPSATNVITSSVAPTVVLGSVTASPSAVWARATGADPFVLGGGVQVSPSAVSAVAGKSDPTVVQSSTTASPSAVSSIASSVNPAVIQGSITLSPTAGFSIVDSVDPTVVQSSITYTPAVVSSVVSSVDPFVIQSSLTLTGIVSGVGSSVGPTVLQSSTTATPTAVYAITSSVGPDVLAGDIVVQPVSVSSIASSVNPTVVQSSLTLSPTAVSSIAAKVDPVVIYGNISYTPTPVHSIASSIDPTVINNVTLTPTAVTCVTYSITGDVFAGEDTYYPNGDDLVGFWLNELNQNTNLWMSIDEVTPDDNDYIKSPEDPGSSIYRATFQDVLDPGTNVLHKVKFRYRKNPDAGTTNMKVRLKENTTTVAEWTYTDVPATWTDGEETLSSAQADSIVDYADLLVEIEAY